MSQNDDLIKVIDQLRSKGAVSVSFTPDGLIAQATFAAPLAASPTKDKPASRLERLTQAEREELAKLKERYEMDEELGNA